MRREVHVMVLPQASIVGYGRIQPVVKPQGKGHSRVRAKVDFNRWCWVVTSDHDSCHNLGSNLVGPHGFQMEVACLEPLIPVVFQIIVLAFWGANDCSIRSCVSD